nr:autotransporter outer membrane beta-barrel domain-containing protein [Brucella intermedia]
MSQNSVANISNSTIVSNRTWAVTILGNAVVNLSGTTVKATNASLDVHEGAGIIVASGTLNVSNGSTVQGANFGIDIEADYRSEGTDYGRTVVIDNSTVQGDTQSAILVRTWVPINLTTADITIQNGSSLLSGNGVAVEVRGDLRGNLREAASANITVDDSIIDGDITVDDISSANVTLRNNAILKGQLVRVGNLTLNSGGTWKMVADGGVANLAMDGGAVEISDGSGNEFHTLTVGTLSGTGTFVAGTHLGLPEGDKLVVTEAGGAKGDFLLRIKNTGADPKTENVLTIVETNGGDAKFALKDGAVDLGTYKYYLNKVGDNWQLTGGRSGPVGPDPDTPAELSESAKTVMSLDAAAANIWYAETGTLRQRLGDVRMGKGENGLWGRSYGRDLKGNGAGDTDFDQSVWGLQAGAEREVNLGGLPIILGVFGGYSNSTVDLDGGSKGEVDSGYGGLYATWLGNDGLYVDGLFKINRFSNDARVVMSDGTGAQGDYSATGVGGQIEIGKTYELASGWYAEPFAQLSALRIGSFNYDLDNGMIAQGDAYGSVQGRIGATFGRNLKLDNGGIFQPYVRVAVAQEFISSNKLRINTVDFNNAFNGTRGEVGLGFAYQLRDALNIHADMDFSGGKGVSQNWGGNIGVSYKF